MNLRFVEAFYWVASLKSISRAAEKLLALQREVKREMGASAPLAVSMRIGAIESVLHSWLIPWLETLRAEHPGLALELTPKPAPRFASPTPRARC